MYYLTTLKSQSMAQAFMTSTRRGGGGGGGGGGGESGGGLKLYHMFTDPIVFKQWIYCLFLRMVEGQKFGHFLYTS